MKLFIKILLALNLIIVIATLGSYLSPRIDPDSISFFSILGLGYPILLASNILFVIIWMLIDIKYIFISIATLLIGYIHLKEFVAFNSPKAVDDKTVSVVSYNIGNARAAYSTNKKERTLKKDKIQKFLHRFNDEDIVCIQEVGAYASDILTKSLNHPFVHKMNKGTMILSKHQIVDKGQIEFGTITNSCLWADLKVGIDTIRVYCVHFQSNAITNEANELLDSPDLNDEETWIGMRGIVSKYVKSHIKRSKQAALVKNHIKSCNYPVLVCGDFNDTPLTHTYKLMQNGLNDNFVSAGNGLGTTFNGRIPLLRIDYILSDSLFNVYNFNIIKENHSDHYPIASELSLN